MPTRFFALLIAASAVLSACGGDSGDSSAARSELAVALGNAFMSDDTPSATQQEADCAADHIVDVVGEERLTELGVTPTNIPAIQEVGFTDAEIGMVLGGFNLCSDLLANFEAELAEDLGADAAACMAETVGYDVLNEAVRATFANDDAARDRTDDSFEIAATFCGLS